MYIYLDESYNLQKAKGKMFISINGFATFNPRHLRKRWMEYRRPFTKSNKRIHANDPYFEKLRSKSISAIKTHCINTISAFQLIHELPHGYFDTHKINFEEVYTGLLKKLFSKLTLHKHDKVEIIIDSRSHRGGVLGAKYFRTEISQYLLQEFANTQISFTPTPSHTDILVELADFISNTFYRAYQKDTDEIFKSLGSNLIQIKNPL